MKIRFKNARLLPFCGEDAPFWGELHTQDDTVAYVGEAKNGNERFDREIDCRGG